MEQIINIVIFIFFYVFIHLIFVRFLNFNINKIFTVFLVFFASLFMLFNDYSYTILLNLVIFNIFVLSFYILIPGVLNNGPAFTIIDLLIKNKSLKKKQLKLLFNKNESSRVVKNRLNLNLSSNLVLKKKKKLLLTGKGIVIVHVLFFIAKFFKLKTYE